jgi:hypothetical protein
MQRSHPNASRFSHLLTKLKFWQNRPESVSSLKQRMENVLRDDRRSIQDPLTYLQATFLSE